MKQENSTANELECQDALATTANTVEIGCQAPVVEGDEQNRVWDERLFVAAVELDTMGSRNEKSPMAQRSTAPSGKE